VACDVWYIITNESENQEKRA